MNLRELETITDSKINVSYNHDSRRFSARLGDAVLLEGDHLLASASGSGPSPEAAQREYAKQIAGRRIRVGGREFTVPESLS